MSLEREARRPIRIRAERPRDLAPAGIHEGDGVGNIFGAEHLAQDGEDFGFGQVVRLVFNYAGLVRDDGGDEDAAPGEEVGDVERLKDGVVAPLLVGVEEVLVFLVPEDF